MSLTATSKTDVSVTVSLRVPRGGSERLDSGVADVLASIECVESVSLERLRSVRPTWSDIRVDATATLTLAVRPESAESACTDAIAARLEDGFGITEVQSVTVIETD